MIDLIKKSFLMISYEKCQVHKFSRFREILRNKKIADFARSVKTTRYFEN